MLGMLERRKTSDMKENNGMGGELYYKKDDLH